MNFFDQIKTPSRGGSPSVSNDTNFWSFLQSTRGKQTSEQYVKRVSNHVRAVPPTNEEKMAIIATWKSFSLDPSKFDEVEKNNRAKSLTRVQNLDDSAPWKTRRQNVTQAKAYFDKLIGRGCSVADLTWGTLSQLDAFRDIADSAREEMDSAYTDFKFLIYGRWLPNVSSFAAIFDLYMGRWMCTFSFLSKASQQLALKEQAPGEKVDGNIIVSGYWKITKRPTNPDNDFNDETMTECIKSGDMYRWLAAAATPDFRKLLQTEDIRQGRNVDELQSFIAGAMYAVIVKYDDKAKFPDTVDIQVNSSFTQEYYEAVSFFATSIRQANRLLFGSQGGEDTRSGRQSYVTINRDIAKKFQ